MAKLITELEQVAQNEGAVLFGVAELARLRTDDFQLTPEVLAQLPYAISIGVPVSVTVLDTIADHPNQLYFHHYRQLNNLLDRAALRLSQAIERLGHRALAVAASQIVDWKNQRAHVSHKRIAVAAGLGWIGRNNLLVTRSHGSQVRLASILTDVFRDAGLQLRSELPFACGECRACIAACPARAIREVPADYDHQACFAQLKEFQKQGYVGQYICGICVRACPGRNPLHAAE